jgi:hypothetical protein
MGADGTMVPGGNGTPAGENVTAGMCGTPTLVAVGDCIGDAAAAADDDDDTDVGCGTGATAGAMRTPGATGGEKGSTAIGAAVTGAARLKMSVADVFLLG